MSWLRRLLQGPSPPEPSTEEGAPDAVERHVPGVEAVLEELAGSGDHAVLDLGPASEASLRVYSRFARWIRFADLLDVAMSPEGGGAALRAVPAQPEHPYDAVFVWDVLDRLFPEDRERLVGRLVEVTASGAHLHLVTDVSDRDTRRPLRFSLLREDRIRYEPTGPPRPARRQLLPAEVERLLKPFQVVRGFTLKGGLREYVAIRGGGNRSHTLV